MTGVPGLPDCDNADGCTVKDGSSSSYGEIFNKGGGGVYAMEWTNKSIKVWWWARNAVPEDIRSGKPSPRGWPDPVASFNNSGCDIDKLFKDHQIVGHTPSKSVSIARTITAVANDLARYLTSPSVEIGLASRESGIRLVLPHMARLAAHTC